MNATDEWFDVESPAPGVWRITEGGIFGSQLVAGDERAILIDAGAGIGDHRGMVEQLVDVPVTLLVTHGHWDHVGNGHQFDDVVAHPLAHDDGVIPIEPLSLTPEAWAQQWLEDGNELPRGVNPDDIEIPPTTGVETVRAGDVFDLGGRELEMLATPGHARGHLAALDREAGLLFASDVVHMDYRLFAHFEGGDLQEYRGTLSRLVDFFTVGAYDTVFFSHVPPLSGEDISLLADFRDGVGAILADELTYEEIDEGNPARKYEVAGRDVLTALDAT